MKCLLILCAAVTAVAAQTADATPKENAKKLVGVWKEVSQEYEGKAVPQQVIKGSKLTLKADGKLLASGKLAVVAGFRVERTFKIDPAKKPATIDIIATFRKTGKDGKTITVVSKHAGIYKLEGDKLTLCYLRQDGPNAGPRPKEFRTGAKSVLYLSVYKREKP